MFKIGQVTNQEISAAYLAIEASMEVLAKAMFQRAVSAYSKAKGTETQKAAAAFEVLRINLATNSNLEATYEVSYREGSETRWVENVPRGSLRIGADGGLVYQPTDEKAYVATGCSVDRLTFAHR